LAVLREAVRHVDVVKNMKQKTILDRLVELGVTESQDGISIYKLDYEELKYELVLAEFRQIDVDTDSNKWF